MRANSLHQSAPRGRASGRSGAIARFAPRLLGPLLLAVLWCIVTYGGFVSPKRLPSPTALVETFRQLFDHGYLGVSLANDVLSSLRRALLGFAFATVIGIPVGLAIGYYRAVDHFLTPLLSFIRPIPPIAFIPLAILYLGIGEVSKVVLIFYAAFIYLVINAQAGVANVPALLLKAARGAGVKGPRLFFRVVIPAALPSILAGMRIALAASWSVLVAAELIAAQSGLGYMIQNAGTYFQLNIVYVGVILIGAFGLLMDSIVRLAERSLLHWQGK